MATSVDARLAHHFNLIASAVAGRAITVHWHDNSRLSAYTDGYAVFLPISRRHEDQSFAVIAQALLIRGGSLRREQLQPLVGRETLRTRYAYAEVVRTARQEEHLLPRRFCQHPCIRDFPHTSQGREDSLQLARSGQSFPEAPEFLGNLRAVLILRLAVPEAAFTALTEKQRQGKMQMSDLPKLDDADEDDSETSKLLKLFSNPLMSGGALANMLNKILGAGRSGKTEDSPESGEGAEMKIGDVREARQKGVFAILNELALDVVTSEQTVDAGSRTYAEWDYVRSSYKRDWTLVDEMDPWREAPESDELLRRLLQPPSLSLKRKVAGIGLGFECHRNQLTGEEILLDRLVDYMLDLRLGAAPSEHIYAKSMRTRRDLAAMVLLDVSGSTGEKDASGLSVHHRQMQLAYHMTCALHELGDQVSCYAFHSWGRSLVRLLRLKSFMETRIDSGMHNRLAMLEPAGYTRTGAALRHAAHKLQEETGMPYRVLIVITDGFSYDHDYEGRYGEEDTRKALEEIRASGVGCLCLTIGSAQDEKKLAEIYGAASTLSVRDYGQFMAHLRRSLLGAVKQIRR